MDKLDEMFSLQNGLQEKLGTFQLARVSPVMRQHYIDRMVLGMTEELGEILRETDSKNVIMPFGWKRTQCRDDKKCKEEIIDLWHFVMNTWLVLGGTPEEFYEMYCQKNGINLIRQQTNY